MSEIKQTHMSREDRPKTKRWLDQAESSITKAELSSRLAKDLKVEIKATEEQKIDFDEAEQFLREVEGSSKTSSALSKRRANLISPERPASQLHQVTDDMETHLSDARLFQEAAGLKLRGMVTPTDLINAFKKRKSENDRQIEGLTEDLEQTRKFLGRYSRSNLIEGPRRKNE